MPAEMSAVPHGSNADASTNVSYDDPNDSDVMMVPCIELSSDSGSEIATVKAEDGSDDEEGEFDFESEVPTLPSEQLIRRLGPLDLDDVAMALEDSDTSAAATAAPDQAALPALPNPQEEGDDDGGRDGENGADGGSDGDGSESVGDQPIGNWPGLESPVSETPSWFSDFNVPPPPIMNPSPLDREVITVLMEYTARVEVRFSPGLRLGRPQTTVQHNWYTFVSRNF